MDEAGQEMGMDALEELSFLDSWRHFLYLRFYLRFSLTEM